jgi:hypothetical protein
VALKRSLAVAFVGAFALALYGAGCGSGGGMGGSAGAGGSAGRGGAKGAAGSRGMKGSGGAGGVSPSEGGIDGGDGGSCTPRSVSGMTFGLNPSARSQGMCTATQLMNIVNDCVDAPADASMTACGDLLMDAPTKACLDGCVLTAWTATPSFLDYTPTPWGGVFGMQWGSGTTAGKFEYPNFGGCIAAAAPGNPAAMKCATDYEEENECWLAACAAGCPVPSTTSPDHDTAFMAFSLCVSTAEATGGPCAKYVAAVSADCGSLATDSGPLGACFDAIHVFDTSAPLTEQARAIGEVVEVVCGPAADGGG